MDPIPNKSYPDLTSGTNGLPPVPGDPMQDEPEVRDDDGVAEVLREVAVKLAEVADRLSSSGRDSGPVDRGREPERTATTQRTDPVASERETEPRRDESGSVTEPESDTDTSKETLERIAEQMDKVVQSLDRIKDMGVELISTIRELDTSTTF